MFDKIDAYSVGQFIYLFEVTTSFAGALFNINTYDQPAVELGKEATFALMGREGTMKAMLATEQKKRDNSKELQKLSEGKKTLKSVFKSKTQKESNILSLKASLEIADQEIDDFRKLIHFLTIYHGQVAIPKFKVAKSKLYLVALNNFCVREISNSHLTAVLYHGMLEKD